MVPQAASRVPSFRLRLWLRCRTGDAQLRLALSEETGSYLAAVGLGALLSIRG